MHIHRSPLGALALFASRVSAGLLVDEGTDSCSISQQLGNSVYCCDGDGIGNDTFDGCLDVLPRPFCPASQVMKTGPSNTFRDIGIGNCWGGDECQWGSNLWEWACCDCPSGMVPETPGVCPEPAYGSRFCVACTDSDETLAYSEVSSSNVCITPDFEQQACHMLEAASSAFDKVGLFATWAGIYCPLTNPKAIIQALVQDIIAVQHAWTAKSQDSGIFGAQFGAASALITSLGAYLIGAAVVAALPEEAAFVAVAEAAGGLAKAYGLFCTVASDGGFALTAASTAAEYIAHSSLCPGSTSKRSTVKRSPNQITALTYKTPVAREDSYNPCSEFLSYFPIDFSLPAQVDDACTEVEAYSLSDTLSSYVANVTAVMQSFCSPYQSSGNSTLAMEFADILIAIQNAAPFCDYSIVTATNTSTTNSSINVSTYLSTTSTVDSSSTLVSYVNSSSTSTASITSSSTLTPSTPSSFTRIPIQSSTTSLTNVSIYLSTTSTVDSSSTSALYANSSSTSTASRTSSLTLTPSPSSIFTSITIPTSTLSTATSVACSLPPSHEPTTPYSTVSTYSTTRITSIQSDRIASINMSSPPLRPLSSSRPIFSTSSSLDSPRASLSSTKISPWAHSTMTAASSSPSVSSSSALDQVNRTSTNVAGGASLSSPWLQSSSSISSTGTHRVTSAYDLPIVPHSTTASLSSSMKSQCTIESSIPMWEGWELQSKVVSTTTWPGPSGPSSSSPSDSQYGSSSREAAGTTESYSLETQSASLTPADIQTSGERSPSSATSPEQPSAARPSLGTVARGGSPSTFIPAATFTGSAAQERLQAIPIWRFTLAALMAITATAFLF